MSTQNDIIESPNLPSLITTDIKSYIQGMQRKSSRRRISSIKTIGTSFYQRRQLHIRRKIISDLSLGFAIVGIIIMIFNEELIFSNLRQSLQHHGLMMIFLDILTSLSTLILLVLILTYHVTNVKVFMIDNALTDIRIALSYSRAAQICIELIICAIHPIHYIPFSDNNVLVEGDILGLLMFLRLYLLGRVLVMHSWINQTMWAQSLGSMNRINFNLVFVIKSAMNLYPVRTIVFMILIFFFWSSWAVRVCEIRSKNGVWMIFNSMWLVAITFLGVGYGDIVPVTNCGKVVAIITGIFGCAITALTVAVLARKLELSSSESYLHYFVMNFQLNKALKNAAANLLQKAWILYKVKTLKKVSKLPCYDSKSSVLYSEKQLYDAIYDIRDIKQQLRRLNEESQICSNSKKLNQNLQSDIFEIKHQMNKMKMIMIEVNENMKVIMDSKDNK